MRGYIPLQLTHINDVRPHMSLGDLTPAEFKATPGGHVHGGALAGSAGSRLP